MKLLQVDDGSVLAAMLRARWLSEGYDVADHADDLSIHDRVRAADAVVHVATGWDPVIGRRDAATVTEVLAGLNGSGKRFLYLSDASVLGDTADSFGNEDNPTSSIAPHPWRVTIERMVLGAVANGVRAVVVRPALVYGPAGGSLIERLTGEAREHGRAVYVDDGRWRTSTINAADLIDLLVLVIEHAAEGWHYLAASPEVLSWQQIATIISTKTASTAVSITAAEASELRLDTARMTVNSVIDDDAAKRLLRWTPHAAAFAAADDT